MRTQDIWLSDSDISISMILSYIHVFANSIFSLFMT